jgi:DNA-binding response OmpR family regulator
MGDKDSTVMPDVLNILLVDDQAIVAHGVRAMFKDIEDFDLHFCQDPRKAFQMARDIDAHLILQDLTMPDIDGITLVRLFRNHPATKRLPIIILSNKENPRDKVEGFQAGANDYCVKLPDKLELVARIRTHAKQYFQWLAREGRVNDLQKQVESMADDGETVRADLSKARREAARLQKELAEKLHDSKSMSGVAAERDELRVKLAGMQSEVEQLRFHSQSLETEIKRLDQERRVLRSAQTLASADSGQIRYQLDQIAQCVEQLTSGSLNPFQAEYLRRIADAARSVYQMTEGTCPIPLDALAAGGDSASKSSESGRLDAHYSDSANSSGIHVARGRSGTRRAPTLDDSGTE